MALKCLVNRLSPDADDTFFEYCHPLSQRIEALLDRQQLFEMGIERWSSKMAPYAEAGVDPVSSHLPHDACTLFQGVERGLEILHSFTQDVESCFRQYVLNKPASPQTTRRCMSGKRGMRTYGFSYSNSNRLVWLRNGAIVLCFRDSQQAAQCLSLSTTIMTSRVHVTICHSGYISFSRDCAKTSKV